MKQAFTVLAIIGWSWTAIFFTWYALKLRVGRERKVDFSNESSPS